MYRFKKQILIKTKTMKTTLKTIANLTANVVKSEGGLDLLMSLIEKLQKQIESTENLLLQDDTRFREINELELALLHIQLDLLHQKVWRFENPEKAWVTFSDEDFEKVWHPVLDSKGNHIDFDSEVTMNHCRIKWGKKRTFGIAPTSQKKLGNAVRDNF